MKHLARPSHLPMYFSAGSLASPVLGVAYIPRTHNIWEPLDMFIRYKLHLVSAIPQVV